MTSEKFNQQLKKEAQQWQEEGFISNAFYEALAQRYGFDAVVNSGSHRFIATIISLGCILLGLGLITFVAANWQVWSKPIKVLLLLGCFSLTNIGGFLLWQQATSRSRQRLGEGLLLLGALSLGANLGLMSQMFHQTGAAYQLYLIWGVAVSLMAYGLGLASLGVMATILIAIAYFSSFSLWSLNFNFALLGLSPVAIACLLIPLTYRCRSAWVFFLSVSLATSAWYTSFFFYVGGLIPSLKIVLITMALLLPVAILWAYQDRQSLFGIPTNISVESLSRKLAIAVLGGFLYLASFHWWEELTVADFGSNVEGSFSWSIVSFSCLVLLAGYWWYCLGKNSQTESWRLGRYDSWVAVATASSFVAVVFNLWGNEAYVATFIINLLLFGLAIVLIKEALTLDSRLCYWSGILLLSLQIISRMFEYNTDLMTKAIALFICGIGIIASGIWFEKQLAPSNNS